jgi:hypothetical protein
MPSSIETSVARPAAGRIDTSSGGSTDGAALWEEIREINQLLRAMADPAVRIELARRRAAAWEQLTLLAIEDGAEPWYAAACACITEVSNEAAERVAGRRPLRSLL